MILRSMVHTRQVEIHPHEAIIPSGYERERYIARLYTKYYTKYDHDAFLSNEIGKLEFIGSINSDVELHAPDFQRGLAAWRQILPRSAHHHSISLPKSDVHQWRAGRRTGLLRPSHPDAV